jgi:Domain of unknown function (DUF5671)
VATNAELYPFVRDALSQGVPRGEIHGALTEAGWPQSDVAAALGGFAEVEFPVPVPKPRPSLSARETFEYLVLFGTLYISAFSLGSLLFQLLNHFLPDAMWSVGRTAAITEAIRWSISWLAVSAPVFLYAARANGRAVARIPLKRRSPVRRWMTYLTLAVASGILIGDSTTLVYNLLAGEISTRFVWKVVTIALIAGTAFAYYLADLRRDEHEVDA